MENKEILTIFAYSFVKKDFRVRFVHEAIKRPNDLHRRVCHEIEKVFDNKYNNTKHTFKESETCLFLGWFNKIKEQPGKKQKI